MGFRNSEAVPAGGKGQPAGSCGLFCAAESGDARQRRFYNRPNLLAFNR
jgi:hypothetical protein